MTHVNIVIDWITRLCWLPLLWHQWAPTSCTICHVFEALINPGMVETIQCSFCVQEHLWYSTQCCNGSLNLPDCISWGISLELSLVVALSSVSHIPLGSLLCFSDSYDTRNRSPISVNSHGHHSLSISDLDSVLSWSAWCKLNSLLSSSHMDEHDPIIHVLRASHMATDYTFRPLLHAFLKVNPRRQTTFETDFSRQTVVFRMFKEFALLKCCCVNVFSGRTMIDHSWEISWPNDLNPIIWSSDISSNSRGLNFV